MGIEYSTETHSDIPVTGENYHILLLVGFDIIVAPGAPRQLDILKHSGRYLQKENIVLKLRENGVNYK